jgi:signal transduction histidine kinase/DNA-binding response OmpR family regulator
VTEAEAAEPGERMAVRRIQRRVRVLLGVTLLVYVAFASWVLLGPGLAIMTTNPGEPQAIALYLAFVALAAAPLALRFLYSRYLVASLTRMAGALRLARDQARQGHRAKADFLATMSHEIRTPMNAVIGFAELLDKTTLDRTQTEYVKAIRESGTHLLSVINDVLDYSKIEAGRIELDEKAFEVVPLVHSCLRALSVQAESKGLRLRLERRGTTPQALFGDAPRLRQVLLNLLSNAVKFTDEGEVVVSLSSTTERDGRHLLRFEVRDTGIGIAPSELPRLFQAFTQADSSPTRRQAGTGLGLAISRRLCELMGGSLTVTSEEGIGSTFTATIRAASAPVPPQTRREQADPLKGLRLLVVDDNAMNRTILARNAQSWGMRVRATDDPHEALGWLRAGDPFDLAIVDQRMPVMDGVRVAKAMRAVGRSLPILLATSAHELPPTGGDRLFAGLIRKPFLAAQLLEALREAAAGSAAAPPPVLPAAPEPAAANGHLRILLVEDNEMNRRLALKVLETLGHHADVAENGAQALDAVLAQPRDVVLMDVHMPVLDGIQATRAICRKVPRGKRPYIIGLSANALAGERERCLGAGMDEYIPKPMDQEKLAALLATVERRKKRLGKTG